MSSKQKDISLSTFIWILVIVVSYFIIESTNGCGADKRLRDSIDENIHKEATQAIEDAWR